MSKWLLALLFVFGTAAAAGATTPRAPFVLDSTSSGDLLLYNPATGDWFITSYSTETADRFRYVSGTWNRDWTVTPARLNHDDLGDVFLYNPVSGVLAWGINSGAGFALTADQWSSGWRVFTADFNADRLHDLLLYNRATGQWFQCVNSGATSFAYQSGAWPAGREIVAADFDGDLRTDVFTYDAASGDYTQYLADTDTIGFSRERTGRWSAGWEVHPVSLNGDARIDLFLYNRGTGDWFQCLSTAASDPFTYHTERWSPGWSVVPADLDGDGVSDIVLYDRTTGDWFQCLTRTGGRGIRAYVHDRWDPGWNVHVTDFDANLSSDLFLYDPIGGRHVQCVNLGAGRFEYLSGSWSPNWSVVSELDRVAPPPAPPPPAPTTPYLTTTAIVAFGDSITFGSHSQRNYYLFERNHTAYPAALSSLLAARYPTQTISVTNSGVPGERTDQGRTRLPGVLDSLRPDLALILEGVNDINAGRSTGAITADLRAMVQAAQARGVRVLVARLTPVGSAYDSTGATGARVSALNSSIASLAAELGLPAAVDLFAAFGANDSLLAGDGLHPADAGYRRIAETFDTAIRRSFETLRVHQTIEPRAQVEVVEGSRDEDVDGPAGS